MYLIINNYSLLSSSAVKEMDNNRAAHVYCRPMILSLDILLATSCNLCGYPYDHIKHNQRPYMRETMHSALNL